MRSVASLVLFAATIAGTVALCLAPLRLAVPRPALPRWRRRRQQQQQTPAQQQQTPGRQQQQACRKLEVTLSYAWAPVFGTLAMLATGVLNGTSLLHGLAGDAQLKPYAIVVLFMSLAYMSTSLDATGCLQWLALHLTRASRGRGRLLFFLYFSLASFATVVSSNDICVMTLTPIIFYCAAATRSDPRPFLTAQFLAANVWSMLLFIGNPTNIIVASAFSMGFAGYSRRMALPTLGAGAAVLAVVLLLHWRAIPRRLASLPALAPSAMLVDPLGAALGSANILACLALLAAAPALGCEMWLVTLVCAALHACYNLLAYVVLRGRWCRRHGLPHEAAAGSATELAAAKDAAAGAPAPREQQAPFRAPAALLLAGDGSSDSSSEHSADGGKADLVGIVALPPAAGSSAKQQQQPAGGGTRGCDGGSSCGSLDSWPPSPPPPQPPQPHPQPPHPQPPPPPPPAEGELRPPPPPDFVRVLRLLPWEVPPFVLGMFCCVEGLGAGGWIDRLAAALGAGLGHSTWAALAGIGALSVGLGNALNNQAMTILMTRVVMAPAFTAACSNPTVPAASAFAVVIASNTAACFTGMGALAGIVFINILQQRGMRGFGWAAFSRWMLPGGLAATLAALSILGAELGA